MAIRVIAPSSAVAPILIAKRRLNNQSSSFVLNGTKRDSLYEIEKNSTGIISESVVLKVGQRTPFVLSVLTIFSILLSRGTLYKMVFYVNIRRV